ncbi:hypothetical protein BpHYR1_007651 [Brachionus plicatilis]|uniref:Uncharacterized protein n=1 Tax=Brachionus plicatilis TaxID=10195 RepID=A0A3M7RXN4_BRAPC|nr:hypothetical protein BpHYR1_007651 [Brachionus plicatilis]
MNKNDYIDENFYRKNSTLKMMSKLNLNYASANTPRSSPKKVIVRPALSDPGEEIIEQIELEKPSYARKFKQIKQSKSPSDPNLRKISGHNLIVQVRKICFYKSDPNSAEPNKKKKSRFFGFLTR